MNSLRTVGRFGLVVLLLAAACSACSYEVAEGTARVEIERGNARFSDLFARGDAAAVAGLYSEDAIVFPPGAEAVKGRQAIQEFWKATRDSGVAGVTLTTVDVGESGDLAYENGTALLSIRAEGQAPTTASAKYVVVWQRQADGSWQLHRDIWNDLPAR